MKAGVERMGGLKKGEGGLRTVHRVPPHKLGIQGLGDSGLFFLMFLKEGPVHFISFIRFLSFSLNRRRSKLGLVFWGTFLL